MLDRMTTTKSMEAIAKARVPQQPHHVTKFKHRSVFVSSDKVLRAPRKIGLATTTAQGRRRPGHESQSVLQGKPVFFEVPLPWIHMGTSKNHLLRGFALKLGLMRERVSFAASR